MPHLPVLNDIWRVTFNWDAVNGVAPRNVMHFHDEGGGADAAAILSSIDARVNADMWTCMKDAYEVQSLSLIKLNGSAATHELAVTPDPKWVGGSTGEIVPNVSGIVSLGSGLRGRQHRGPVFVGPCTENSSGLGYLTSTAHDAMQAGWDSFRANMATDTVPLQIASYRYAGSVDVSTCTVREKTGSVRSRLKQLPFF